MTNEILGKKFIDNIEVGAINTVIKDTLEACSERFSLFL